MPRKASVKSKAPKKESFSRSDGRNIDPAYTTGGALQPAPPLTNAQLFDELGSSGLTRFGGTVYEEFVKELRLKGAPQTYKEMRENSPVISAILFAIEMSLRRVKFYFEPPDDKDHELSDFLDSCLEDMSTSWQDTLSQILTMLQFGYSIHELVYKVRKGMDKSPESKYDDGRIGWRKWLPISQETLAPGREWIWDETGGVQGINQIAPPDYRLRTLPIEKMLLFRTSVAKNNPEGRSLLRSMYIPYYYVKNFSEIEGIATERQGCGIPVMYMGKGTILQGANSDVEFAKQVVRDVRTDEQSGVVIPYPKMTTDGYGMLFEIVSANARSALDFDKVISRYEKRMAMSCLAQFIMLGMENVGSYALSKDNTDMFVLANTAWAEIISQIISKHAVPRLLKLNTFKYDEMPQLKHSEINVPDLQALGTYINQMVGAQLIVPDDNLEDYIRQAAHLPDKPEGAITISQMQEKQAAQADEAKKAQLAALQQAQSGNGNGNGSGKKESQPSGTTIKVPEPGVSSNPGEQAPARGLPKGTTEKASDNFGWITMPNGAHVLIGDENGDLGNSEAKSMPKGLMTKSEDLPFDKPPKHSWRWVNKTEVDAVLSGKQKYGGQPSNENEKGNWFSPAPGNFAGYGKYLIEVSVPSKGVGLDAPKNSVGLDKIVGIWEHKSEWDNKVGDRVNKFTPIKFKENNSAESFQVQTRRAYGGAIYETKTNEYQRQLETTYLEWADDTSKKLAKETDDAKRDAILTAAIAVLLSQLKDLGRNGLLEAMQLTAGTLSGDGLLTLNKLVTNNETWLENSLIPSIQERMRKEMSDPAFMLGGIVAIQNALGAYVGRVASYSGGYWNAIHEGVGETINQEDQLGLRRVERVLDTNAEHCKTCPPKAGTYRNWDAMVQEVGIPGDGSDQCFANCRCYTRIETSPGSGVFERM